MKWPNPCRRIIQFSLPSLRVAVAVVKWTILTYLAPNGIQFCQNTDQYMRLVGMLRRSQQNLIRHFTANDDQSVKVCKNGIITGILNGWWSHQIRKIKLIHLVTAASPNHCGHSFELNLMGIDIE